LSKKGQFSENSVVDLAHARVRLRSRAKDPPTSLNEELSAINNLLDEGHSVEAKSRAATLITAARKDREVLAGARLALSIAQEMHGDYRDSLEALAMYEPPETRAQLSSDLAARVPGSI
jgi:hypothetical protein